MDPAELERLVDRELKALPGPRAPRTLLPRVLAATTERRLRSWPARTRWAAPPIWRAACLALPLVALAWAVTAALAAVLGANPTLSAAVEVVREASAVARIAWRLLLGPVAVYLLVLSLSFGLACAVLWTALDRIALGGASRP